jgi:hypothetical protein
MRADGEVGMTAPVKARSLFDTSIGEDNLFGGDKHRVNLRLTAVNLANKVALYNFLSTFSGTHYLTPYISFRTSWSPSLCPPAN